MDINLTEETKLLASYCTYKALFEEHKTIYDIVAAFIEAAIKDMGKGIIISKEEIQLLVEKAFGIIIPTVVIVSAAKKVQCLKKEGGDFKIIVDVMRGDSEFEKKQQVSIQTATDVLASFRKYLNEQNYNYETNEVDHAFMNFLLDDGISDDDLKEHISSFIIKNCNSNEKFKENINNIRRGHCLLTGLTNNGAIYQTNSWNGDLIIYLDMEILFHLVGYNGNLYEKIAKEFIDVAKKANSNKGSIKLKYFQATEREIRDYFYSTRLRMNNADAAYPLKDAMKCLLKKCKYESDLIEEEAEFFKRLNKYGIHVDEKEFFKDRNYDRYNLESLELIEKYANENSVKALDKKNREKVRGRIEAISNINKLREGKLYNDYRNCRYIFVTGTIQTLKISHDFLIEKRNEKIKFEDVQDERANSGEFAIEYAVTLSQMTNAIWFRLNNTLLNGKIASYPMETDAVIRAQIIVASLINQRIDNIYESAREKLLSGEYTKEDIAAKLETIAGRQRNPDDITAETVDDDVTILKLDDIQAVRNEKEYLRHDNMLKDEIISKLKNDNQKQSVELEELRADKEKNILNIKIEEMNNLITKYETAIKKCKHIDIFCKVVVTMVEFICVGVIWFLILRFGWDVSEKYTYLFSLLFSTLMSVINYLIGGKIGLQDVASKFSEKYKMKYKSDTDIDIQKIRSDMKDSIKRLDELEGIDRSNNKA